MLVLPIKKKWFDMIKSGEKKEEYREIKPYYRTRLIKYFGARVGTTYLVIREKKKEVIFRNGYSHDSPKIKCLCTITTGKGKKEWRS